MSSLIRNKRIVSDEWKTLLLTDQDTPDSVRLPVGPLLVPLSVWQARRAELIHREYEHGWPLGIWLSTTEGAGLIANDVDDFTVIAVEFDQPAGHRSDATAQLLRTRYGYQGELRALVPAEKRSYLFDVDVEDRTSRVLPDRFNHNSAVQQLIAA